MLGICRFIAAHKKLSDWLFASLICGFGLPLSFFLWYFNLYKGAIRDTSFRSEFQTVHANICQEQHAMLVASASHDSQMSGMGTRCRGGCVLLVYNLSHVPGHMLPASFGKPCSTLSGCMCIMSPSTNDACQPAVLSAYATLCTARA